MTMCDMLEGGTLLEGQMIGFIGGGNMAKAIGTTLLQRGVLKSRQVYVSAPSDGTLEYWKSLGVNTTHKNQEVVEKCSIIILAFKPYQLVPALENVTRDIKDKLFVSILVGVSCDTIVKAFGSSFHVKNNRIIRVMPNVAVAVGRGCTVMSPDAGATEEDIKLVQALFSPLGSCEKISENLMESAAAIVGSGPAYIFMIIEAMADGAVKHGIPRELAQNIAAQTVLGASKIVVETKKHPGQLKDEVCSPGGTTICAVHELEKGNVRGTFMNAIDAAVARAQEIKSRLT